MAPATVQPNHELTYTLAVTNHGPSDAIGLSLTDSIPAGTTFKRTKLPASWTCPGVTPTQVACTDLAVAHLAPNATDTLLIVVGVGSLGDGTTILSDAAVGANTPDPGPFSNADSASTQVFANSADMSVTKTGSPGTVAPGYVTLF